MQWSKPAGRSEGVCRSSRSSGSIGHFELVWLSTEKGCRDACAIDPECLAYEFGGVYSRCELHYFEITHVAPVQGYICVVKEAPKSSITRQHSSPRPPNPRTISIVSPPPPHSVPSSYLPSPMSTFASKPTMLGSAVHLILPPLYSIPPSPAALQPASVTSNVPLLQLLHTYIRNSPSFATGPTRGTNVGWWSTPLLPLPLVPWAPPPVLPPVPPSGPSPSPCPEPPIPMLPEPPSTPPEPPSPPPRLKGSPCLDVIRRFTRSVSNMPVFRNCPHLQFADLSGIDLSFVALDGVDLRGAILDHANLRQATFHNAVLHGVSLVGALLVHADFTGADLSHAIFWRANADEAVFARAKLERTSFVQATLRGALLTNIKEASWVDFGRCDLGGASVTDSKFAHASFKGSSLRNVKIERTVITYSTFSMTMFDSISLKDSSFERSNLTNADLDGLNLERIGLQWTNLQGAKLRRTNLRLAQLHFSICTEADFTQATLSGADMRWTDLRRSKFVRAVLSEASLQDAAINTADFRGAVGLNEANFVGARGLPVGTMQPCVDTLCDRAFHLAVGRPSPTVLTLKDCKDVECLGPSSSSHPQIRCCSLIGSQCFSICPAIAGEVPNAYVRRPILAIGRSSWIAAEAECQAQSLRLCQIEELRKCCGTGCSFDTGHVWSSQFC